MKQKISFPIGMALIALALIFAMSGCSSTASQQQQTANQSKVGIAATASYAKAHPVSLQQLNQQTAAGIANSPIPPQFRAQILARTEAQNAAYAQSQRTGQTQ